MSLRRTDAPTPSGPDRDDAALGFAGFIPAGGEQAGRLIVRALLVLARHQTMAALARRAERSVQGMRPVPGHRLTAGRTERDHPRRGPGLRKRARRRLRAATAGDSFAVFPRPAPSSALVTTGIYARARYPIYGGWVLAGLGFALALSPWALALTGLLALGLNGKSRVEEGALAARYPDYRAYRQRVPRRFFPLRRGRPGRE